MKRLLLASACCLWAALAQAQSVSVGNPNVTQTVGTGTTPLGTATITAGTCATVINILATGVVTTDIVLAGFASDPTGVTDYIHLTIVPFPTADHVNFRICNPTLVSITQSALTINWKAIR